MNARSFLHCPRFHLKSRFAQAQCLMFSWSAITIKTVASQLRIVVITSVLLKRLRVSGVYFVFGLLHKMFSLFLFNEIFVKQEPTSLTINKCYFPFSLLLGFSMILYADCCLSGFRRSIKKFYLEVRIIEVVLWLLLCQEYIGFSKIWKVEI